MSATSIVAWWGASSRPCSREKGLLDRGAALAGLAVLAKYGRYKNSIIEDARLKLEVPQ
jgi:hypothetical protein